jgi:hypothetical protein
MQVQAATYHHCSIAVDAQTRFFATVGPMTSFNRATIVDARQHPIAQSKTLQHNHNLQLILATFCIIRHKS